MTISDYEYDALVRERDMLKWKSAADDREIAELRRQVEMLLRETAALPNTRGGRS